MRKALSIFIIILCLGGTVFAEESENPEQVSPFSIGIYGGLHFFYPDDVNSYIEEDLANYMATSGFKSIILAFDLGLGFKYMFNDNLGIKAGVDGLLAPKIILSDTTRIYLLSALCTNMMGLAVLPLNDDLSLFAGIGPDFYWSWFRDYFGYTIGGRAELGIQVDKSAEVSIVGRYAKVPNREQINGRTPHFNMDFTGIELRATYWFNL